jgi:hypothetical protein
VVHEGNAAPAANIATTMKALRIVDTMLRTPELKTP